MSSIDVPTLVLVAACALAPAVLAALRWPERIVDHPWLVLGLLALISGVALGSVVRLDPPGSRIHLDPSSEPLIPASEPGLEPYRQAVRSFGTDDVYVVAMETNGIFTHANLETLRRITDEIRKLPGVREAESLTRVYAFRYEPEEDAVHLGWFIDDVPTEAEALAELRARALQDRLYRKTLVSADARTAAINVTFQPMTDGEFVALDLDGRIQTILDREGRAGQRFFVAGRPHVRAEAHHLMVADLVSLIPLSVVVAAAVVWVVTGSMRGVVIPLLNCLIGALWAFGAMALVGRNLNVITLVLGPMLICVGSVYGVHIVARYEHIALDATDPRAAALDSLRYTRIPVVLAGVTTCVGFGALLLADTPATSDLGAFAVLGVASVTLLSLTGVPAALAILPLETARSGDAVPLYQRRTRLSAWLGGQVERGLHGLGRVTTGRPNRVLAAWIGVAAVAVLLVPRIRIDTDFLSFFDERSRVRTDFAAVSRLLTGAVPLYVVLEGQREGGFREPEALRALGSIQARLEATEGVSQVLSAVDLVRVANRAFEKGRPEADRVPDTRDAVAEVVFMIPKEKLRRFSTSNHSSANLIVRTGLLGSAHVRALEGRIGAVLSRSALPDGIRARVIGNAILINRSADGIAGNQFAQVGFAAVTILLLVILVFRSPRIGVLSMVPNVIPVLIFFGMLGAGAAPLSLATGLIGSIALGIAIDDTVHFLATYRRKRAEGSDPEHAARRTLLEVGRPIAITSVMLVAGFLVMLLSGFATLREFGYLTALTMGICLATDLALLPALLVRLRA